MKPYTREVAESDLAFAIAAHDQVAAYRIAEELDRMEPKPPPSLLGVALWYASIGLPVFPLMPQTKLPYRHTRGVLDATTNPVVIRRTFAPTANVGIATGHGVDVIDFDGKEGHLAWGKEAQAEDVERWPAGSLSWDPDDPPTGRAAWAQAGVKMLGTVSTPRAGGLHVYVPSNGKGNRAGLVGKGSHVDYRGLGGYVVAPPSVTPDGSYRWQTSLDLDYLAGLVRRG